MVFIIGPTDDVYIPVYTVIVTTSAPPSDPGPGNSTYLAELAAKAKTNEVVSRVGPVAVDYDPEMMSFLSGEV